MTYDSNKTIREIAVEVPSATRVFEKFGIDYCCGGGKKLNDVCQTSKLAVDQVLAALEQAEASRVSRDETPTDWAKVTLGEVIDEVVDKHHAYVRNEIPRLNHLAEKVSSKHGPNHPELMQVRELWTALADELSMHMMKEEQVLFPYIIRMEEAVLQGQPVLPPMFGTVQNPIRMMMSEHDSAGDLLRKMHEATGDFAVPADACGSYRALYTGLLEFEADLHQHIHLENNILFPRSIAMEEGK